MEDKPKYTRPTFDEAVKAWKALLTERGLPADLVWLFDENLVFERDPASPQGYRLGFQTAFTPPPPDAERLAYDYFSDFLARLVFYRIGSSGGKSVCVLLCDPWFEARRPGEGFERRDPWLISFRPGDRVELEEIRDEARWENRILRDRPLHDLDFCMPLRSIHEILAHGRVLSTYERSTLKVMHLWKRVFRQAE